MSCTFEVVSVHDAQPLATKDERKKDAMNNATQMQVDDTESL